jgi:hypothetical protein
MTKWLCAYSVTNVEWNLSISLPLRRMDQVHLLLSCQQFNGISNPPVAFYRLYPNRLLHFIVTMIVGFFGVRESHCRDLQHMSGTTTRDATIGSDIRTQALMPKATSYNSHTITPLQLSLDTTLVMLNIEYSIICDAFTKGGLCAQDSSTGVKRHVYQSDYGPVGSLPGYTVDYFEKSSLAQLRVAMRCLSGRRAQSIHRKQVWCLVHYVLNSWSTLRALSLVFGKFPPHSTPVHTPAQRWLRVGEALSSEMRVKAIMPAFAIFYKMCLLERGMTRQFDESHSNTRHFFSNFRTSDLYTNSPFPNN